MLWSSRLLDAEEIVTALTAVGFDGDVGRVRSAVGFGIRLSQLEDTLQHVRLDYMVRVRAQLAPPVRWYAWNAVSLCL
jgi:hypothetical protein